MVFASISSGSSGNSIYIGSDTTHILVDAGISGKRIEDGLRRCQWPPSEGNIHFSREILTILPRNTFVSREKYFRFSRELDVVLARNGSCSPENCLLISRETLVALAGLAKSVRQASSLPPNPMNLLNLQLIYGPFI